MANEGEEADGHEDRVTQSGPPNLLQQTLGATGDGNVDPEAGTACLHYIVQPEFCHTGGIAQGGFVTGWLDAAMSFAVMARLEQPVWLASLELKVSFLKAARAETEVVAKGWVVKQGRSIVFLEGKLEDIEGTVLATSSSTAKLVPLNT